MIETDFSPLKGLKFKCLDGCGYCCTFQPELLKNEYKFYQNDKRTRSGVILGTINDPASKDRYSFPLQKNIGGCVFLEDKKCKIYNIRPMRCRTFPINISFNWRIQLNVNMSCRGLWYGEKSQDLYSIGKELLSAVPVNLKREYLYKSKQFYDNLPKDFQDYIPPMQLKKILVEYIKNMDIKTNYDYENGKELLKMQLNQEKFTDLLTYVTKDLRWDAFKLKKDTIQRIQINENGDFRIIDCIDFSEIKFRTISSITENLIKDYLKKVVERDYFIGIQYKISKDISKEPLINSALKNLAILFNLFIMELNMLATFDNIEIIDEEMVKEGIILMDGSVVAASTYYSV